MKKKRWLFLLLLAVAAGIGIKLLRPGRVPDHVCGPGNGQTCQVFYLLNLDGMKGLGHSALMLVDGHGEGRLFSYNGMQYNLIQCLMGKEGIGKMKEFGLSADEVEELLETGNLNVEDFAECDNFDRALFRYIDREQYDRILMEAEKYAQAGDEFERLYAELHSKTGPDISEAQEQMDRFLARPDLPRYQIYRHNCDTAARELLGLVDEEMASYNASKEKLTPSGNYKNMCALLGETWGYMGLGQDSLLETLLW